MKERERGRESGGGRGRECVREEKFIAEYHFKSKAFMTLKNGNISVNFSVLIKDIISLNLNVFIADNGNNNMIM